ncbi:MAG: hypothetical protein KDA71_10790 [Planctomycetales bacterium]|nr:hypothetical protein [Planctomycetales bacterium]
MSSTRAKRFVTILLVIVANLSVTQEKTSADERQPDAEASKAPPFDPPHILVARGIDEENRLILVGYQTIFIGNQGESYNSPTITKAPLGDVKIMTVAGKAVPIDEARRRLSQRDTPILCSSWEMQLPAFYAKLFAADTLHFIFPRQAPAWKPIAEPGRPNPQNP